MSTDNRNIQVSNGLLGAAAMVANEKIAGTIGAAAVLEIGEQLAAIPNSRMDGVCNAGQKLELPERSGLMDKKLARSLALGG